MLDKNLRFISGNRLFIRATDVIAGTDGVRLRTGSLDSELKLGRHIIPEATGFYNKTVSLTPDNLGITANRNYPIRLTQIVLVKKLEKEQTVQKLDLSNEGQLDEAFLSLYNSASQFSESFPNFVLGCNIPYPDVFTPELRVKRRDFVLHLLQNVEPVKIEGKLDDISKYIVHAMRR
jgi:hypothetical protein